MPYFKELVKNNKHILWNVKDTLPIKYAKYKVVKPFDYSVKYGGTYDSFKYYNNYVVLIKQ